MSDTKSPRFITSDHGEATGLSAAQTAAKLRR